MPDRVFIARLFLIGGGVLALAGFALWFMLPVAGAFPAYLVTALLALGYGGFVRRGRSRPLPVEKK